MAFSKYKNKLVILVVTVLLSSQEILAARKPPAPTGAGGFGEDGGVVGSPIDGLLPILLAAALLYGILLKLKSANNVLD